ncbi:MAG: DUF5906 domain-containing protein [Clostridiales bacterium]|jgi:P4 family phage/plasmid primase-like protien|nr:DUF5906 domain-containing protein [Clostridiales bacterium]
MGDSKENSDYQNIIKNQVYQDFSNNCSDCYDNAGYLDGVIDDLKKLGCELDTQEIVASSEKTLEEAVRMARKESLGRLSKDFLDSVGNKEVSATDVAPCDNNTPCDEESQASKAIESLIGTGETTALHEKHPIFLANSLIDPEFFRDANLVPDQLTETTNGVLAGEIFRNHLVHCEPLGGFLVFTGKRWEKDEGKARGFAMSFASRQLQFAGEQLMTHKAKVKQREEAAEAAQANGTFDRKKNAQEIKAEAESKELIDSYYMLAKKANTPAGIKKLLRSMIMCLDAKPEEFDANPVLLNTPSGTVNLRTGELLPHNSADRITQITSVSPSFKNMDKWLGFIKNLTSGDKEFELFLQKLAGSFLLGIGSDFAVLALGDGNNGKSLFFDMPIMILRDYVCMLSSDVITANKTKNIGAELATLKGKRLALVSEIPGGKHLDVNAIKRIASTDFVLVNAKYCNPVSFEPSHTFVVLTNNYPVVRANDCSALRRIIAVPFSARFDQADKTEDYEKIFFEESGGAALQWMIEGAYIFISQGFSFGQFPDCVEEETKQHRLD